MEIKAIETVYDGHKFRSRLEARWAVVFNSLYIPFEYELEGFDLGDGMYYLPDFYMPMLKTHVEIKPSKDAVSAHDVARYLRLTSTDEHSLLLIVGSPGKHRMFLLNSAWGNCESLASRLRNKYPEDINMWFWMPLYEGSQCHFERIMWPGIGITLIADSTPGQEDEILWAMDQGKQARFEHGETP